DANQVLTLSVQVSEAVRQTSESATQVADTINQMAAGSSRQAEHAASICRKMEDTGHQVEFGFEQAEKTARQTHSSTQAAYEGKAAMRAAVAHLGMINQTVTQSTESIQRLATRSEEIGGIVTTITDISSQTNLLALNAAIEAARAGVQGRGFAVVAEEVRKLADETKRAAEQIAQLISTMQTDTYATVKLMENNLAAMQQQAAMIGKGDESLDLIVSHVEQTDLDAGQM
ncbi:methyl-accepting chemotaxis protein, partial [Microbacteriaceae bacterium K1510]|nr:methyl-accepting chemotaxis protein [Microbacteriaceae bacterium K1510]